MNLIDQPGAATWPIVSATFLLLPKDPKDPARSGAGAEVHRLGYTTSGGKIATDLEYIPLPKAVQDKVRAAMEDDRHGRTASRSTK